MTRPHAVVWIFPIRAGVLGMGAAWGQGSPVKPIRFSDRRRAPAPISRRVPSRKQ